MYLACDSIADRQEVQRAARQAIGTDADYRSVDETLDGLVARAPLLQDGNRFLNLAVPLGTYTPSQPLLDRFSGVVRSQGRRQSGAFVIPVASCREAMQPRRNICGTLPGPAAGAHWIHPGFRSAPRVPGDQPIPGCRRKESVNGEEEEGREKKGGKAREEKGRQEKSPSVGLVT